MLNIPRLKKNYCTDKVYTYKNTKVRKEYIGSLNKLVDPYKSHIL